MNNQGAFTLIEMILAIGVAAIVLIAVNAVFFTSLHLRDDTSDMVDAATPLDATVSYLKRDLQCCVNPTNGAAGAVLSGGFRVGDNLTSSGVSDPVAVEMFTATGALSASQPWGDIQRVTYELRNPASTTATGKDLYRSVLRNLLSVGTVVADDQLMLSGVADVRFSCYSGGGWQDSWDTTNPSSSSTNLPSAVRVVIQMSGNPNAQPVQIVVPIDTVARTNAVLSGTTTTS